MLKAATLKVAKLQKTTSLNNLISHSARRFIFPGTVIFIFFMFSFIQSLFTSDAQAELGSMKLIVGLGNPGDKYMNNRHNIGFMAIDAIADNNKFPAFRSKFDGAFSEGRIGQDKVILLKPMTYMNESGRSVQKAAKFFKVAPEDIYVFHDELDLKPFKMKARLGGGLAGHNGLKSIKQNLGTEEFHRVKMGIGHPGDKNHVTGYVLGDFAKAEQLDLEKFIDACVDHIGLLLKGEGELYMTKVSQAQN